MKASPHNKLVILFNLESKNLIESKNLKNPYFTEKEFPLVVSNGIKFR